MASGVEHIGIAVKDLNAANKTYSKLLNTEPYKTEEVLSEGVKTSFFKVGETKIELLAAQDPESPIFHFINRRGEGIHHIALAVEDIISERNRLIKEGFTPVGEIKEGADNKLICFFHPKDSNGVLIELCQER